MRHVARSLSIVLLGACAASSHRIGWIELVPAPRGGVALRPTAFPGAGQVTTTPGGAILLGKGDPLTGVTWKDAWPFPRTNYRVELEVVRRSGHDFFCALTFPVVDGHCTLVLGGWGGELCGLSCIDGQDASQNATTTTREFRDGEPVSVRVDVTSAHIRAWVDGDLLVDQEVEGHEFSVRWEVEPCRPFGLATYETTAELRRLRLRPLPGGSP